VKGGRERRRGEGVGDFGKHASINMVGEGGKIREGKGRGVGRTSWVQTCIGIFTF
jgi:hypothetical protein